jgi:hypothetical protein
MFNWILYVLAAICGMSFGYGVAVFIHSSELQRLHELFDSLEKKYYLLYNLLSELKSKS